ncbi:MAG: enoyl-CoA hydratase [Lysobacterales bacterium]|jgi:enoyl-CoA hydratase
MTDTYVSTRETDGVLHITIDRQEKMNALNVDVLTQLQAAFETAKTSQDIVSVILTGAGQKAFVAGADIAEMQSLDNDGLWRLIALGNGLMSSIENLGKPVIAAVNGYALGGGCELALACHLRIASSTALLGLPEVQLGLMPGYGGSQRLARLVGQGRALEMTLSGKPVTAAVAKDIGLVNRVVEPDELLAVAGKLAAGLANSAPCAMKNIITAILRGADGSLEEGLSLENKLFAELFETEDMREGTSAFLEKRKPEFKGS